MSLTKTSIIDRVEVTDSNVVQVRENTSVYDSGKFVSSSYKRWSIYPGQDYSTQEERVKAVCAAVHTPENVAQYQQNLANED